jgi:RHS repeat-associated protein
MFVFFDVLPLYSQVQLANNQVAPNFEMYRDRNFMEKEDISYTGNLGFSIPLVEVPGRHGHNFAVQINYSSNIGQQQTASWVGLGWSLEVGYVQRAVMGRIDEAQPTNSAYVNALGQAATGYYRANLNGRLALNVNNLSYVNQQHIDSLDELDNYTIDVDNEGMGILPVGPNAFTDPASGFAYGLGVVQTFLPPKYEPWVIFGEKTGNYAYFNQFSLTKNDGTIYDFGLGSSFNATQFQADSGFNYLAGGGGYLQSVIFPYRWNLSDIKYPDGSVTSIVYGKTDYAVRTNLSASIDRSTSTGFEHLNYFGYGMPTNANIDTGRVSQQYCYPETLYTDTHYLVFVSSATSGSTTGESEIMRKLDAIILYDRATSTEIKRIVFAYATNHNSSGGAWQSNTQLKDNQLTLISIQQIAGSQSLPPYQLGYTTNPAFSLWNLEHNSNFYGYYTDTTCGTAWRLQSITLPTGGTVTYSYESFNVSYDPEGNSDGLWKITAEPIGRIKSKTVADPLGTAVTWNYTYSDAVYDLPARPVGSNFAPRFSQYNPDGTLDVQNYGTCRYMRGCTPGFRWVKASSSLGYFKTVHFTSSYQGSDKDPNESYPDVIISSIVPLYSPNGIAITSNFAERGLPWRIETSVDTTINHYRFNLEDSCRDLYEYYFTGPIGKRWGLIRYNVFWTQLDTVETHRDGVVSNEITNYNSSLRRGFFVGPIASKQFMRDSTMITENYGYGCQVYAGMAQDIMLTQLEQKWQTKDSSFIEIVGSDTLHKTTQEPLDCMWTDWRPSGNYFLPAADYVWAARSADTGMPGIILSSQQPTPTSFTAYAYTDEGVKTSRTKSFTPPFNQTVTYDVDTLSIGQAAIYIGTTSGGNDIATITGQGPGSFSAIGGTTYYVTASVFPKLCQNCSGEAIARADFTYYLSGSYSPATFSDTTVIELKSYDLYDSYSNLLQSSDAAGDTLLYFYGSNTNSFSNSDNGLLHAYMTGVQTTVNGTTLSEAYKYNNAGQVIQKTDENGNSTYYTYDAFHRLSAVSNWNNDTLSKYTYNLVGNSLGSSNPNSIVATSYRKHTSPDSTVTRMYFDGIWKQIQSSVSLGDSDIVTAVVYDSLSRKSRSYEPYSYWNPSHVFDPSYDSHANAAYPIDGSFPYYAYTYTPELDGRLLQTASPGTAFDLTSGHTVRYAYGANASGELNNKAGTLYKSRTTDENGTNRVEYRDFANDLVCTVTDSSGSGLKLTTFSNFDPSGNLIKTIPPNGNSYATTYTYDTRGEVVSKTSPDAGTVQYLYDKRGNLRLVKDANHTGAVNDTSSSGALTSPNTGSGNFTLALPGVVSIAGYLITTYGGSPYVVINVIANGVVVLSLTTNSYTQVNKSAYLPQGSYSFTASITGGGGVFYYSVSCNNGYEMVYNKYDPLNRLMETGEYQLSYGQASYFTQANAYNPTFPTSNTFVSKKFYYDSPSVDPNASGQTNIKGRLSYSESYCLGSLVIRTSYSYDNMGRVAWMVGSGFSSSSKKLYYSYDLQGNVTQREYYDLDAVHHPPFITNYTYDQAGRLSTAQFNSYGQNVTEAAYQYFASGKPSQLTLGSSPAATATYNYNERDWLTSIASTNFWEHIGYNKTNSDASGWNATFSFHPQWNGNISWGSYSMNGVNFGLGGSAATSNLGWNYVYDNANRLDIADFGYSYYGSWSQSSAYDMSVSYDHNAPGNGNITQLTRNGPNGTGLSQLLMLGSRPGGATLAYGAATIVASSSYTIASGDSDTFEATTRISLLPGFTAKPGATFHARITSTPHGIGSGGLDQLSYNYQNNMNKLSNIANSANGTTSYYAYDNNGNIVSDSHTSIALAIYDISNQPVSVYLTNGNVIQYAYDANGNRMEKVVNGSTYNLYINGKDGSTEAVSLAPCCDNVVYNILANGENVAQVDWAYNGGAFTYYYYLKDHLGDIKMTLGSGGNVVGYNDYYPFGLTMAGRSMASSADGRYQYTAKERDAESGLDYFGARYYDSWRGQWLSVDPKAEKYQNLSPYNYAAGNPIKYLDSDGGGINLANGKKDWQERRNNPVGYAAKDWQQSIDASAHSFLKGDIMGGVTNFGKAVANTIFFPVNVMNNIDPSGVSMSVVGIGAPIEAAGTVTDVLTVRHYTNDATVKAISESGQLNPVYVTTPSEIPPGATAKDIEKMLEIEPGKGDNYIDVTVSKDQLKVPENGGTTSGGKLQWQTTKKIPVDSKDFKRTDQ